MVSHILPDQSLLFKMVVLDKAVFKDLNLAYKCRVFLNPHVTKDTLSSTENPPIDEKGEGSLSIGLPELENALSKTTLLSHRISCSFTFTESEN